MSITLYQASVPVHVRQLNGRSAILGMAINHCVEKKIDPSALLQARLYPDMFPATAPLPARSLRTPMM